MKRTRLVLLVLTVAFSARLSAQTTGELFQKLKHDVNQGSWTDALATLDRIEAVASQPGNESLREQLEGPTAFTTSRSADTAVTFCSAIRRR